MPRKPFVEANRTATLSACAALLALACAASPRWPGFDVLQKPAPAAKQEMRRVPISSQDYATFVRWGEEWFRSETFGGECATTDVAGLFQAELEIPCEGEGAAANCRKKVSALPYLVQALDRLDGVTGNL